MASDLSNDMSKMSMSISQEHVPSSSHHSIEEFPDESSLFVGDLSRSVTEETLQHKFAVFGEVEAVDIKRDKVTKNNLGYGFVKFRTRQQAEVAKQKLHGAEIGGRNIRIGWAQKNTNLFVGDLDGRITSSQLQEIFRQFGPIYEEDTFVKKNKYGFVKFKYRAHAERAKQELDGQPLTIPGTGGEVTDRPIRIGWGDANTQRNCVHVQFDASSAEIHNLQEEDFRKHFAPYGHVLKVSLPRYADRRLKGYGFIHFQENDDGEESAARAITTLSGEDLSGVLIQCNFGKRQNNRHKRHPRIGGSPPRFDELSQFPMHMNAPPPFPMYGSPYGPYTGFPPGAPQPHPHMMMGHPFGAMIPDGRNGAIDMSQMSPSFRGVAPPPHPGPRLGPPPSLGPSLQNGMSFPGAPQAFHLSPDPNRLRGMPPSPSPSVPSPLFAAQAGFGAPTTYDHESVLPPAMIPSAGNMQPVTVMGGIARASPPMMPTIPLPFGNIPTAMAMPTPAFHQPSISPLFMGAIPPTHVSPTLGPRPAFATARQG